MTVVLCACGLVGPAARRIIANCYRYLQFLKPSFLAYSPQCIDDLSQTDGIFSTGGGLNGSDPLLIAYLMVVIL